MKVSELMAKLAAMFPASYPSREGLTGWVEIARPVLGHLEGLKLDRAFEACMATWDKGFAPKPADIAKFAPEKPRPITGAPGVNMRRACAIADAEAPRYAAAWRDQYADAISQARENCGADLASLFDFVLSKELRDAAYEAALGEGMYGHPFAVKLTAIDLAKIVRRVTAPAATRRVGPLKPLPSVVVRDGPSEGVVAPAVEEAMPVAPLAATEEPLY